MQASDKEIGMDKANKIFSIGALAVVFMLFIQLITGVVAYKIFGINLASDSKLSENIEIDWEALYPFDSALDAPEGQAVNTVEYNNAQKWDFDMLFNIYGKILEKLNTIGEICAGHMFKYESISKLGYAINTFITEPKPVGKYIRLNNGCLTTVASEEASNQVRKKVVAIYELNNYLNNKNIPFVYIQSAVKNCKYDMELVNEAKDYTNKNIDKLLLGLDNADIDYIDMRDELHKKYDDHYQLFYKADHHWNVNAGFWACGVIEDVLQERYGINFCTDYNDESLYENKLYKYAMFGSAGNSVTHFVEESEDFAILFPRFDTNFRLTIPDKGINSSGSFEELFVDYASLDEAISNGGGYAYETILYGNRPLVQIKNNNNKGGPKVLMIRDSFSIAVAPYMALGCSELDLIDVRASNGNFSGSIRAYADQMKPDIVIMLVSSPGTSYK